MKLPVIKHLTQFIADNDEDYIVETIETLEALNRRNSEKAGELLAELQQASIRNENLFEKLMEVTKVCSLGQITNALFEVGGQYRRNM